MPATISITTTDVFTKLREMILAAIGPVEVVQGIDNRVPAPNQPFVLMTEVVQMPLSTNVATYLDTYTPAQGLRSIEAPTQLSIQLDFYGPNAASWAKIVSALLRDPYGCDALAPVCAPLYATDARMVPIVNGEQQYERRYMVDAVLEYNPVVAVDQQFADGLDVTLINVDVTYPP